MKVASSRKNLLLLDALEHCESKPFLILNLDPASSVVLGRKSTRDVMQEITLM